MILNLSSVQIKRDPKMFKLKSSPVPPCLPLPNLQVALLQPPDTERLPLGLKRPVNLQARQAHPVKPKLTRGTLTTLIAGTVSSVRSAAGLPVSTLSRRRHCMENVLLSLCEVGDESVKSAKPVKTVFHCLPSLHLVLFPSSHHTSGSLL